MQKSLLRDGTDDLCEELRRMRDGRNAEAATADRTARLYDCVLRWALGIEAEAAQAGVPLQDYLVRGPGADHVLWLEVAAHRERYPASSGPTAVAEAGPWAPVGEALLQLGSSAEVLVRLANLADDRIGDGFLAGSVAYVEALAYREAVRAGLVALHGDGRIRPQTYRILEDLAACRCVHDPALGTATGILLDQLEHAGARRGDGDPTSQISSQGPGPTPTFHQMMVYTGCLPIGDTQRRVLHGDEDSRLPEIINAFEAVLADRRRRFVGTSSMDAPLIETISICRRRLDHTRQGTEPKAGPVETGKG